MPLVRHSVCALDCPDTCSILVTVEGDRTVKLRGNPDHPVTQGFLCAKVTRYLEREYSPERVLYPQRRCGAKGDGRFVRISWDEALDEIASRLKETAAAYGPEAVLPYSYAGTMGFLNGSGMDRRFFHRFGASRLDRTICSSTGSDALTETMGFRYGTEPEQFRHSRLIIAWGANVRDTNVHLWPFIVEARRQGARFYVIDPVKNRTACSADRHFTVNPGSDAALALGLAHVIINDHLYDADYVDRYTSGFEALRRRAAEYPPARVATLTGLAEAGIVDLAREYATTRPAVIRVNYGVQRSERGGASVRAISILPALTGSWKEPGGGLLLSTSSAFPLNKRSLDRPDLQAHSPLGREARLVNMSELGKALTSLDDPPVKALFVYNSNPAVVAPNRNLVLQGLRQPGLFTVVAEQMPTDTSDYADILLPATTFLEHTDLYSAYGHYYLQLARPAVPPAGEAKSNVEIFRLLAKRLGFDDPCFDESEDDMLRSLLAANHRFLDGITLERLDREHFVRVAVSPEDTPFLPFAEGGFGTPSGKFEFGADSLDYTPPVESRHGDGKLRARYPLELISLKGGAGLNSTFGNRPDVDHQTSTISICPSDAAARGIADGDRVRLFNDRGSCILAATVGDEVVPGVVCTRSVRWGKMAQDRKSINVLTSDRLADIGGGPTFYSCLIEIEKCEN